MKTLITAILPVLIVSLAHGDDSSIKEAWSKEHLSPAERTALVERSKKEPFAEIAPVLLKALVDFQPYYGINSRGDTPWNKDRLTPRDRSYLMASAVWQHHMSPGDDLPKAQVVLSLLRKASRQAEKSILIRAIVNYQWCLDAEHTLLAVCRDAEEPLTVRRQSAEALMHHCDLNTYMPIAVEIILAHEVGLPRSQAFNFTINQGNRLFKLSEENRRAVLATGFDIVSELSDEELKTGYFVARRLGFILKVTNEFTPDQKSKRYQGKHGLKDEFFIDTVRNARKWHSKNKKELQSN